MAVREMPEVDELDHQLIRLLSDDPRRTNRKLAELTGVTEITVASRIRLLGERGVARIIGALDWRLGGPQLPLVTLIKVGGRPVHEVAQELTKISECRGSSVVSGPFDIVGSFALSDATQLRNLIENKLPSIRGIQEVETSLVIDICKFDQTWAKHLNE